MPPLISPEYWMNSQLSIARYYGGCSIAGRNYFIDKESNYLVRGDFQSYVKKLGFKTVKKAVQRYADLDKGKQVLKRLTKMNKARKRAEKSKKNKEETLF